MKTTVRYITTEMAKMWKAGIWKHTYTNFRPKTKYIDAYSGDYIYRIRLIGKPVLILDPFDVPKGYLRCLSISRPIYRTRAKLQKIIPRKLRKGFHGRRK